MSNRSLLVFFSAVVVTERNDSSILRSVLGVLRFGGLIAEQHFPFNCEGSVRQVLVPSLPSSLLIFKFKDCRVS